MSIKFRVNGKKVLEVIVWLLNNKPGLTRYTLSKVLYYADKAHLEKHGRPVTGDRYIAMEDGMVPSLVLDMLERDRSRLDPEEDIRPIEEAIEAFSAGDYEAYKAKREADAECLSRTDIECLSESLDQYGDMSVGMLWDLAHSEAAWEKAWNERENSEMSYEDMVPADHPKREELIERLRETSEYVVF